MNLKNLKYDKELFSVFVVTSTMRIKHISSMLRKVVHCEWFFKCRSERCGVERNEAGIFKCKEKTWFAFNKGQLKLRDPGLPNKESGNDCCVISSCSTPSASRTSPTKPLSTCFLRSQTRICKGLILQSRISQTGKIKDFRFQ